MGDVSLDSLIERTKNLPARRLANAVTGSQLARARRDTIAQLFAQKYVETGNEVNAYKAMGQAMRRGQKRTSVVDSRGVQTGRRRKIIRQWMVLCLPHLQKILAEGHDRAAQTIAAAYDYCKVVLETNPTTFMEPEKDGLPGIRFNPFRDDISDAQRSAIVGVTLDIETGQITKLSTASPMQAVREMRGLIETESLRSTTGRGAENIASRINERYQRARLQKTPEPIKLQLIQAEKAIAARGR